ncbi:MAG: hypothetical protein AAFP15_19230, partial [Bacteroidota bacterium]
MVVNDHRLSTRARFRSVQRGLAARERREQEEHMRQQRAEEERARERQREELRVKKEQVRDRREVV